MSLHSDRTQSPSGALPPRGKIELTEALDVLRRTLDPRQTKTFAKAVASLLFFEFGEKPTSSRVRALIGHGSLGTVVEGIELFWDELRREAQGSAAFADLPDLPSSLSQQGGELLVQLWRLALSQATSEFEQRRADHDLACAERIAQADASAEAARTSMNAAQDEAASLQSRLASMSFERDLLTTRMAADERSLAQAQADRDGVLQRLVAVEADAIAKLRNSDLERARLLKEIDQAREAYKKLGIEHGRELAKRDTALSEEMTRHAATQALCQDQQQTLNSLTATLATQAAVAQDVASIGRKRARSRSAGVAASRKAGRAPAPKAQLKTRR